MLDAVRRFATRVVLVHLVLLALVIGVVAFATYHIYRSARDHAIRETSQRQELLARQTAAGIESYYKSIITDLTLLQRSETASTAPATAPAKVPAPPPTPRDARPPEPREPRGRPGPAFTQPGPGTRPAKAWKPPPLFDSRPRLDLKAISERKLNINPVMAGMMWRLLETRAAALFVVDSASGEVIPQMTFPPTAMTMARTLASENATFIGKIKKREAVSPFVTLPDGSGAHLIAIPATGGMMGGVELGERVLVAVVPVSYIRSEYFEPLSDETGSLAAALVDRAGVVMVSIDPRLAGRNVSEMDDPEVASMLAERAAAATAPHDAVETHDASTAARSWTVDHASKFGDVLLPPRIVAADAVDLPGRRWTVVIITPLAQADAMVAPIFRSAMGWAVFLSLSITAIFASTAIQLVRSRVRLERARHEMLERELKQARGIQLAWLPDGKVPPRGLDVAATNIPASHISGDFYNWFELHDGRTAVCIGDVTGHGMSAAFLMATTQLLIRSTMMRCPDPGKCLEEVNHQLCTQAFQGQFVTLLLLVVDTASGIADIASAGHPAPLVAAGDGTVEGVAFRPLKLEPQFLLGVERDARYQAQRLSLPKSATMLLYTDGVVEASAGDGPQFGREQLLATLRGGFTSLQHVLDAVVTAVQSHTGKAELADDVTLVAVRVRSLEFKL